MSVLSTRLNTVPIHANTIELSGPGRHLNQTYPKASTQETSASPLNSSDVQPPFKHASISDHLVGPPPSFEANILEVEADIAFADKRAEAAREYARNSHAIDPVTPPELSATAAQSRETSAELASEARSAMQPINQAE